MGGINVVGLGKAYKQYTNRWLRLAEWLDPRSLPRHRLHWVLQDINFSVLPGEAVGIVGVNGAGKSTLLKMITGTTQPTTGRVHISGRVAALLELGMGFHPDFTGRQNVFMAGQLLGYSAEEIARLMPEIEAFADIGDYIDQPVRVYSSGMQVRLAFSVATAECPDVLIVDEALAVGDAAFQRKCHRRIKSFIEKGTSLLFVSHDIEGVKKLCSKVLYLNHGRMVAFGEAKPVCDQYETMLFRGKRALPESGGLEGACPSVQAIDQNLLNSQEVVYGNGGAFIEQVWIENSEGNQANVLVAGEKFSICYIVGFQRAYANPAVAMLIKTVEGVAMYGTHSKLIGEELGNVKPGSKFLVRFLMTCYLSPATYFVNCGVTDPSDFGHFLHRRVDTLIFKVSSQNGGGHDGLVDLNAKLYFEPK
ncbi:ABC transporter ATP-binding protein [Microvirgula aerodenitrificans]|uniref:ABC transporter ATP-binding protein n=1 Tax=Microvirgula aerodenitrificans TaxID=57480 RepID=UPI0028F16E5F|nr:ABC transporter ATP-binding protein [Microvirgula aerodenitrificans]